MTLKQRVYDIIIEPPEGDLVAKRIHDAILILIGVSVLVSILDTVESLSNQYKAIFYYFELVSVVIFSIEYALRLWACTLDERFKGAFKGRLKMATSPMTLIDLMAILPFYIQIFFPMDLRLVRILRLFRLFRLFRSGKLSNAFGLLGAVIRAKKEELVLCIVILLLVLICSSSVMFLIERQEPNTLFTSIPATMWWGMMTITTIGYGDMYPVTDLGRFFGAIVGFFGICVFALPVGILGTGFSEELRRRRIQEASEDDDNSDKLREDSNRTCPYCGK